MESLPYVLIAVWCLCPIVGIPLAITLTVLIIKRGAPVVINPDWKSQGKGKRKSKPQQQKPEPLFREEASES